MDFFRSLVEDFKAWRRGERRVAPRQLVGRVYAPKDQPAVGGAKASRAKGKLTMHRRVFRADTGRWENLPDTRMK